MDTPEKYTEEDIEVVLKNLREQKIFLYNEQRQITAEIKNISAVKAKLATNKNKIDTTILDIEKLKQNITKEINKSLVMLELDQPQQLVVETEPLKTSPPPPPPPGMFNANVAKPKEKVNSSVGTSNIFEELAKGVTLNKVKENTVTQDDVGENNIAQDLVNKLCGTAKKDKDEITRYQKTITTLKTEIEQLVAVINKLNSDLETEKASMEEYKKALQAQTETITALESQRNTLQKKYNEIKKKIELKIEKKKEESANKGFKAIDLGNSVIIPPPPTTLPPPLPSALTGIVPSSEGTVPPPSEETVPSPPNKPIPSPPPPPPKEGMSPPSPPKGGMLPPSPKEEMPSSSPKGKMVLPSGRPLPPIPTKAGAKPAVVMKPKPEVTHQNKSELPANFNSFITKKAAELDKEREDNAIKEYLTKVLVNMVKKVAEIDDDSLTIDDFDDHAHRQVFDKLEWNENDFNSLRKMINDALTKKVEAQPNDLNAALLMGLAKQQAYVNGALALGDASNTPKIKSIVLKFINHHPDLSELLTIARPLQEQEYAQAKKKADALAKEQEEIEFEQQQELEKQKQIEAEINAAKRKEKLISLGINPGITNKKELDQATILKDTTIQAALDKKFTTLNVDEFITNLDKDFAFLLEETKAPDSTSPDQEETNPDQKQATPNQKKASTEQKPVNSHTKPIPDLYTQFQSLLEELNKFSGSLSTQKKYERLAPVINTLYIDLNNEFQRFQKNQTKDSLKAFKKASAKAINRVEKEFKHDCDVWKQIHPIIKGILGVLSVLTIIPAVVVAAKSKYGYFVTFFSKSNNNPLKELNGLRKQAKTIKKQMEQQFRK
jgi:hypothetical protein